MGFGGNRSGFGFRKEVSAHCDFREQMSGYRKLRKGVFRIWD